MPHFSYQLGRSAGRNWGPVQSQLFCVPRCLLLCLECPRLGTLRWVCSVSCTDTIVIPGEDEATSQLSHRQAWSLGVDVVEGFGLAPQQGSPASSPHVSCCPACSACPRLALPAGPKLGSGSATTHNAQPGRLNTWGLEAQKTGNVPLNHLCRFLKKMFTCCKDSFQPLVHICPFSPLHLPVVYRAFL